MKKIDPVCRVEVIMDSELHSDYKGKTYYFNSKGCMDEFTKDPEKFINENEPRRNLYSCC